MRGAGYDDGQIAEIVANVALNLFTNYFNHVAGTEVDFPVAPERLTRGNVSVSDWSFISRNPSLIRCLSGIGVGLSACTAQLPSTFEK